jgi:hypothetical protein
MPTKEYMLRQERELEYIRNTANHVQYNLSYIDVDGSLRNKTITLIKGMGDHMFTIRAYASGNGWGLIDVETL